MSYSKRGDKIMRGPAIAIAASLLTLPALAAAPAPSPTTQDLVTAATKEGKVAFYTSIDLEVAQKIGKAFETKYPGITVDVERSGAERIYQRIFQEYGANIHTVDVVESSDASHLVDYKRKGFLAPYVAEDVTKWPAGQRDPDGTFAAERVMLTVVAYNTKLVKPEDAPKSFADLLDPKWKGKMVKSHPGYSGNTMTATFELSRALGWPFFQKLGQQQVLQVQSSTEPPKKLALGERAVMVDGNEYNVLIDRQKGAPITIVYPTEGTPLVAGMAGLLKEAPHPNAARLFVNYLFSREGQQFLVSEGELRSFHPEVQEPTTRTPLKDIKVLTSDPVEQEKAVEEIKQKYAEYFGT
jgi:iron(III) transport system substrate-binding protein